jgi:hypothetical protein
MTPDTSVSLTVAATRGRTTRTLAARADLPAADVAAVHVAYQRLGDPAASLSIVPGAEPPRAAVLGGDERRPGVRASHFAP